MNARTHHMLRRCLVGLLLAVVLSPARAFPGDADTHRFLWDQANSMMATATTPSDFRATAAVYEQLVRQGVRNGPLYYNLGTALLKAGLNSDAITAFRQAERYEGSTREIRNNMTLASRNLSGDKEASLPWYRFFLFWHYELPAVHRAVAASIAFTAIWLALLLIRLGLRSTGQLLAGVAVTAFILLGSSWATSWHEDRISGLPAVATQQVQDNQAGGTTSGR